jgi:hypothetical protein
MEGWGHLRVMAAIVILAGSAQVKLLQSASQDVETGVTPQTSAVANRGHEALIQCYECKLHRR